MFSAKKLVLIFFVKHKTCFIELELWCQENEIQKKNDYTGVGHISIHNSNCKCK